MAVPARDYRSWSFTDRSFLFAVSVSVLWHLFWFFSVSIVVTPANTKKPSRTKFVSIGPVLDDAIFQTLIESRPEYSKAFYRELSDIDAATQLPAPAIGRQESGEVTSLPLGANAVQSLHALMSGQKSSPEEFLRGTGFSPSDYFKLSGDAASQQILSRPNPPDVNDVRPVELDFDIDGTGKVASIEVALSSGDIALDQKWEDHLRQWLFASVLGAEERVKGRVTFRRTTVREHV